MARIFGPAGPGYRTAALAAALGLGIAAAAADARAADTGWYFGVQVPVMFIDDTESDTTGNQLMMPYKATATSEYDAGFKFAGVVGYELGGGLRAEGELFFARAKVDKVTYDGLHLLGTPIPLKVDVPISGAAKQMGGFASIWYDFDTGTDWTPYFGGGIGFIRVDQGGLDYDSNALFQATIDALQNNPTTEIQAAIGSNPALTQALQNPNLAAALANLKVPETSTTDTMFAYHLGVGIGYQLDEKTTIQFGYRLQTGSGLDFSGRNTQGIVEVDTDLRAHLFEIGFRTRF